MRSFIILIILLGFSNSMISQSAHKSLRKGDKSYLNGEFAEAEADYRKALNDKKAYKGNYNLGNSIYKQERFEEAIEKYQQALQKAESTEGKHQSYYNLGNAYAKKGDVKEAIDAYKNALKYDPEDKETMHNLQQMIIQKLQQQQQQQQQQEQENQDQDQSDENQEQQEQGQQQEQQEQQNQPQPEEQDINNEQTLEEKEAPDDLSKEDAQKLLQIIENEEKKVQEKMRKKSGNKKKPVKDW